MAICDCCAAEAEGCIVEPVHGATLCPTCVRELSTGAALIAAERDRQIEAEGWTAEHDDEHDNDELLIAAVEYIQHVQGVADGSCWPWEAAGWKPSADPVRNLVKAGALIAAEIDRLLRMAGEETA